MNQFLPYFVLNKKKLKSMFKSKQQQENCYYRHYAFTFKHDRKAECTICDYYSNVMSRSIMQTIEHQLSTIL